MKMETSIFFFFFLRGFVLKEDDLPLNSVQSALREASLPGGWRSTKGTISTQRARREKEGENANIKKERKEERKKERKKEEKKDKTDRQWCAPVSSLVRLNFD